MHIAALILAAGRASRFGSDKRLAVLPDGRTVLDTMLALYGKAFDSTWVVIGPDDEASRRVIEAAGAKALVNEAALSGMGHSLACGAMALMNEPQVDAVVLALADMPAVHPATLQQVCQALQDGHTEVVPVDRSQAHVLGHPRGLSRAWLPALSQLQGDQGARALLDWQRAHRVEMDDPGVWLDADTPADLARMIEHIRLNAGH